MISKLALLSATVFLSSGVSASYIPPAYTEDLNILVKTVDNLETVTAADFDDNYIGAIFYKSIKENKKAHSNKNNITALFDADTQEEVNVEVKMLGKYFYEVDDGSIGEGYLMGTDYTTNESFNKIVESTKSEIASGEIQRDYKTAKAKSVLNMQIGESWKPDYSTKWTWTMDYDGVHYGSFSEWYSTFTIVSNNYIYYLFAHETYVSPNRDNTDDFRTSNIIYDFKTNNEQVLLRDYQPKAMNPEMTISYGSNLGGEISSDLSTSISVGVSSSYSVSVRSPQVLDKGNMARDEVYLDFAYHDPKTEDEPWYSYNINQSMQTSMYIVRKPRNSSVQTKMTDHRIISMQRDHFWFWLDKLVNFNGTFTYNTEYTNF